MTKLRVQGVAFDMYGTVVDVGAVAEACKAVASDPVAFNNQWRAKQLEYTFLRAAMGKYQDFWKVSQQALAFTIQRFGLTAKCHHLSVSEVPVPLGRYAWGKTSEVGRDE